MARYVRVADGRLLAYETWGDPNGSPVFLLHGTPGCRLGPRPRAHELALMGLRLIAYDRPGYGLSDRHRGRRVADAADDVRALANALHIDRFAVVGRSGGAPHALACAALLRGRVTGAAALVSLAPHDAAGLDWFAGMGEGNVRQYTMARHVVRERSGSARLARHLAQTNQSLITLGVLGNELPDADRQILTDPGIRGLLVENFRQAVGDRRNVRIIPDRSARDAEGARSVVLGRVDDVLAFSRDWGFQPADIRVPLLLWHGEDDVYSPVDHSRWLAERIPDATLVIEPGAAHFGSLVVLPSVLQWLRRLSLSTWPLATTAPVTAGRARGHS